MNKAVTAKSSNVKNVKTLKADLPITGMTCAAGANRIEKQLKKQIGVETASVNFATERATINYEQESTKVENLIQTIRDTGYDSPEITESAEASLEEAHQAEYAELKRNFLIAAFLSLPVLLIAMSHGTIDFLNVPGVT